MHFDLWPMSIFRFLHDKCRPGFAFGGVQYRRHQIKLPTSAAVALTTSCSTLTASVLAMAPSRPGGNSQQPLTTIFEKNAEQRCCFSSDQATKMSLRRPPFRKRFDTSSNGSANRIKNSSGDTYYDKSGNNNKRKSPWRSHSISLDYGNYGDEDDGNEFIGGSRFGRSLQPMPSSSNVQSATTMSLSSTPSWEKEEAELANRVRQIQREDDERRKKWLENAQPSIRQPIIDNRGRSYGRGGRKTASARVWIQPGFGNFVINRKDFVEYFQRMSDREHILKPLAATETLGRFDVKAVVEGGGLTGQAGAIRHGLARALNHYNPVAYRPPLKRLGYLTRDPRKVERKKIGHLKARKKPQWNRR